MDPRPSKGRVCSIVVLLMTMMMFMFVFVSESVEAQQQNGQHLLCYNYTWTGRNTSVDCRLHNTDIMNEAQPCLHTLVYTIPPELPPNTSDIHSQCSSVQRCPSFICQTDSKKCIKLSWYDITGTLVNYSSFCGNAIDVTDETNRVPLNNIVLDMQVETLTKRVMVCDQNLCNGVQMISGSRHGVVLSVLLTVLLMVLGKTT